MNEWRIKIGFVEFLYRSGEVKNFGWHMINKIGSGKDDITQNILGTFLYIMIALVTFKNVYSSFQSLHSVVGCTHKRFGDGYLVR